MFMQKEQVSGMRPCGHLPVVGSIRISDSRCLSVSGLSAFAAAAAAAGVGVGFVGFAAGFGGSFDAGFAAFAAGFAAFAAGFGLACFAAFFGGAAFRTGFFFFEAIDLPVGFRFADVTLPYIGGHC